MVAIVGAISLPMNGETSTNPSARQTEMVSTNLTTRQSDKVLTTLSARQTTLSARQTTLSARQTTPEEFLLYPRKNETIPEEHIRDGAGNLIVAKVTNPTLTAFIPSGSNTSKAAVIICPGGGYTNLHIQREGFKVAEAFSQQGVAAFVLKYRLPDKEIVEEGPYVPLKDAQRAIQLVRENASEWGIDPGKIGIMGFSAGGHLAATAGVHHDATLIDNERNTSLRPDFMILLYPVISFDDKVGHVGSKKRLIGDQLKETDVLFFSNELHVNSHTPKSILFHAGDDKTVPVENSLLFYKELSRHNVPAELHVYSKGEHGFSKIPAFTEWFNCCIAWMKAEGII